MEGTTGRRSFLQKSGIAILGSAITLDLLSASRVRANATNTLKVGLVGCGGRGTGAALQALKADNAAVLTAVGDVFPERIEEALNSLASVYPEKSKVEKDKKFVGFDSYKKVIDSGVDVVLLATPPVFRPAHFAYSVDAGKHTFCEKPVAIDAPGVRQVLAAAKLAKDKNLSVVSGFCYRYDNAKRAFFNKVSNGELGKVLSVSTTRNGGELWTKPRQAGWSDMEYQLRNWLYYNWLSGDFISEMMVHSLDLMSWALGDKLPVKATGTGGRQVRVGEIYGNVYDHFAVEYEYPDGIKGYHFSRQQEGCSNANTVSIAGTTGMGTIDNGRSLHQLSGKNEWKYSGKANNMYETQHEELFAAIRKGKAINEGERMANSSMLGVLGRMVAYTGQTITWEDALKSEERLGPKIDDYSWDLKWKENHVALPGKTKFS